MAESRWFYSLLGLAQHSSHGDEPNPFWARLKAPNCDLMLAQASGEIDPTVQAALIYLHAPDVAALREHLLANGVTDGGSFNGGAESLPRNSTAFAISHPFYMPDGELRVHDPDGYVLLIGQLG